jgi:prepilin-type N-terminal cleavage/methylation domain-containing protein
LADGRKQIRSHTDLEVEKGQVASQQAGLIGDRLMQRIGCNNRNGFSLTEAMMATVVLGIAAAGVLLPFTSGAAVRAEGLRSTLAARLASDLMEQIVETPYSDVVSAYDGYNEPKGWVKDAGGTVFSDPSYANFSRSASCEYVYVPQEPGTQEAKYIRATVRVYYSGREIAVIGRLISK